jgi:hypothetical protein
MASSHSTTNVYAAPGVKSAATTKVRPMAPHPHSNTATQQHSNTATQTHRHTATPPHSPHSPHSHTATQPHRHTATPPHRHTAYIPRPVRPGGSPTCKLKHASWGGTPGPHHLPRVRVCQRGPQRHACGHTWGNDEASAGGWLRVLAWRRMDQHQRRVRSANKHPHPG